jgi:hypothetical protein
MESVFPPPEASATGHLQINTAHPGLRQVHDDPPLFEVADFLTLEECQNLIDRTDNLMERAPVVMQGAVGLDALPVLHCSYVSLNKCRVALLASGEGGQRDQLGAN